MAVDEHIKRVAIIGVSHLLIPKQPEGMYH
jgi:hypothetical protein